MTPSNLIVSLLVTALSAHASVKSTHVIGWGQNLAGEACGSPSKGAPVCVVEIGASPMTNIVAVAAGRGHSLALRGDGTVLAWGFGYYGQTSVPAGLSNVVGIAAGYNFSVAIARGGQVVAWGRNDEGQINVPVDATNVAAVSAASFHALALRADGTVTRWGRQTDPMPKLTNIVAIAAGGGKFERNLALRRDGTIVAWGGSLPKAALGLTDVVAIAAGEYHSLTLKRDGTVFGWGGNECGQATGIPSDVAPYEGSGLVKIAGQTLTNVVAIAAGNEYGLFGSLSRYSLALRADGTVVAWGQFGSEQAVVPARVTNVMSVSAGHNFCLAIITNGIPALPHPSSQPSK